MKRVMLLWMAASLLGMSCAGGYQARRGISAKSWFELRSPHFILRTDTDQAAADRRIHGLESQVAALTQVYAVLLGHRVDPPQEVTELLVFDNCSEVEALHANALGFVTATRDFEVQRIMVTCEGDRYATQVFMHELVHVFNHHAFGPLPMWLEEGLAEYLMTVDVENGQVVMGHPFVDTQNLHGHEIANMPTLEKVLQADWRDFQLGAQREVFYLAAKNLVGVLCSRSPQDQARFFQYLRLLAKATDRNAAWAQTFGAVSQEALGEDMRLFHTRPGALVTRLGHFEEPGLGVEGNSMRKGEVHAMWVQAQLLRGKMGDVTPLLQQIDAAVAEDPQWPDADFWRAAVYRYQARPDLAKVIELLRGHVARRQNDERAYLGLLGAEISVALGAGASETFSGTEGAAKPRLEDLQADALALAKIAASATALNEVAWYFALRKMPDVGLGFARRSLEADATCSDCMDTLALLLAENGRFDEAYQNEEAAVGMVGDRAASPGVRKRLELYRTLADRCRAQPTVAPCPRR